MKKNFDSLEAYKNHLEQFIAQKDAKFWKIIKMAKSSETKWHICD